MQNWCNHDFVFVDAGVHVTSHELLAFSGSLIANVRASRHFYEPGPLGQLVPSFHHFSKCVSEHTAHITPR